MCLGQLPDPARNQPLTSCKKPHRTEILPEFVRTGGDALSLCGDTRPEGPFGLRQGRRPTQRPERPCRHSLVEVQGRVVGRALEGHCWIHRKAGLLPPIERGSPTARWDGQPEMLDREPSVGIHARSSPLSGCTLMPMNGTPRLARSPGGQDRRSSAARQVLGDVHTCQRPRRTPVAWRPDRTALIHFAHPDVFGNWFQ